MEWSPPTATKGRPIARNADSITAKSPSASASGRSPWSSMRPGSPRSRPPSVNRFPAGLNSTERTTGGAAAEPRRNEELRSLGTPTRANPRPVRGGSSGMEAGLALRLVVQDEVAAERGQHEAEVQHGAGRR